MTTNFFRWTVPATLLLTVIILNGCKHNSVAPKTKYTDNFEDVDTVDESALSSCDTNHVSFYTDVYPFIISSCAVPGCHDVPTASENVILTSYKSIMNSGDDGDLVIAGQPEKSRLYKEIEEGSMPPDDHFVSPKMKQLIYNWILQGAKDDICSKNTDTTKFAFNADILPVINKYCTGCHSGAAPADDKALTNYDNIKERASDTVEEDNLYNAINERGMPPYAVHVLNTDVIKIRKWIEAGMPNN